jgi:pimeloyl-ACP methyl ester carboxylesterase
MFGLSMLRVASLIYWMFPNRPPFLVRTYSNAFRHEPLVTNFLIPSRSGSLKIRMYTPQHALNAPMIVLVHGFAVQGNEDPALNNLAVSLCHLGLRVVVPNIESERTFRMSETAVDDVDDVVRWSALTSGERVSLFGVSYSGGMVISAAAAPEFADYVKMIFCVSGYNSIDRLGRYYLHDDVRDPGSQPYGDTSYVGALAPMALQYLDELVPPEQVKPLAAALQMIPVGTTPEEAARAQHLTAAQTELLDDVLNVKTEEMRTRYHALLERHRAELAAISPMGKIGRIHGSLFVLQGVADPVIPRGEAEWTQREMLNKTDGEVLVTPWMHHALLDLHAPFREKVLVGYFMSQMLDAALRPSPLPASNH